AWPDAREGGESPGPEAQRGRAADADHGSPFAAPGPAPAGGKVVFGHITMFGLYPARFYNVWLDVKPAKGHRVLMQSYPAGIQSGMDYYLNDAGLMVSETTIEQTRFHVDGIPLTNRIRKALQYGDTIDDVVKVLKDGNNGLYTNEWLLADAKTNEIAMFELGTTATRLWRSSKNEWFGGNGGVLWGVKQPQGPPSRVGHDPECKERAAGEGGEPDPPRKEVATVLRPLQGPDHGRPGKGRVYPPADLRGRVARRQGDLH